jgi:hypothetical protein
VRARAAAAIVFVAACAAPALLAARASYAAHCREIDRIHTQPALDARALTSPGDVIAVEAAGSSRFHSGRVVLDLVGLNDHRLAHAKDDRAWLCRIIEAKPALFVVPAEWIAQLQLAYELRIVQTYASRPSAIDGGASDALVVAARGTLKPEAAAFCDAQK